MSDSAKEHTFKPLPSHSSEAVLRTVGYTTSQPQEARWRCECGRLNQMGWAYCLCEKARTAETPIVNVVPVQIGTIRAGRQAEAVPQTVEEAKDETERLREFARADACTIHRLCGEVSQLRIERDVAQQQADHWQQEAVRLSALPKPLTDPTGGEMSEQEPRTRKAIRGCAEWLAACVRLGWRKSDLDALEALWWKYHDHQGDLIGYHGTQPLSDSERIGTERSAKHTLPLTPLSLTLSDPQTP